MEDNPLSYSTNGSRVDLVSLQKEPISCMNSRLLYNACWCATLTRQTNPHSHLNTPVSIHSPTFINTTVTKYNIFHHQFTPHCPMFPPGFHSVRWMRERLLVFEPKYLGEWYPGRFACNVYRRTAARKDITIWEAGDCWLRCNVKLQM